jgi:hypothetical protein
MESSHLSLQYVSAEGPDGLARVLDNFYEKAKQDPAFAAEGHYILYKLGDQKSLIKVDMSQEPFQFYYNDLLGRPATRIVKETIARFLWDTCGERERFFEEFQGE